jgi:hypothetical protein
MAPRIPDVLPSGKFLQNFGFKRWPIGGIQAPLSRFVFMESTPQLRTRNFMISGNQIEWSRIIPTFKFLDLGPVKLPRTGLPAYQPQLRQSFSHPVMCLTWQDLQPQWCKEYEEKCCHSTDTTVPGWDRTGSPVLFS